METVTISLETYNSMKSEIETLKKKNTPKEIEVEVYPKWYATLQNVGVVLLGLGFILQWLKIISF
ncbi:MAG: hypothetical protein V4547_09625 [Bacteroidota bacterium]